MSEPKIKLTLGATLPTDTQYENVQPVVEVEADTFEEAATTALHQIKHIADKVRTKSEFVINEVAKNLPGAKIEALKDISGVVVQWLPDSHKYLDDYLSGSAFSHKFIREFPRDRISGAISAKSGIPQEEIISMWELNAEASTSLGTSIHAALELFGRYYDTSIAIKGTLESVEHKNPFLRSIQKLFFKGREQESANYEVFVANEKEKLCGFIDRLVVVDSKKKIVRVQDYKTNPNISKPKEILAPFKTIVDPTELGAYWLQLSFYAYILQTKGYTVEGLDIFNIVPEVNDSGAIELKLYEYEHDVIDISEALKGIK